MNTGILGALQRRGIEFRDGPREYEYKICCLFCEDMHETKDYFFRLGFNVATGQGHCFNCEWNSRKALIQILRKLGEDESVLDGAQYTPAPPRKPEVMELPKGFIRLDEVEEDDPLFGKALRYLRNRRITPRQIRVHGIGATIADEKYGYRIIFPITHKGKVYGFTGRDWTGKSSLRYMNNSGGAKIVFNADNAAKAVENIAVVSEGIVKALAIERALRYKICSTALCGKDISKIQEKFLRPFKEIVLFPDPEPEGMRAFLGVGASLESMVEKVSMVWPWPKKQADEMEFEDIRAAFENRRTFSPLLQFMLKNEARNR